MAYLPPSEKEKEEELEAQRLTSGVTPGVPGVPAGPVLTDTGQMAAPTAGAALTPTTGTYGGGTRAAVSGVRALPAITEKNVQQALDLAQRIGGGVAETSRGGVQEALQRAQSRFAEQLAPYQVSYDETLMQKATSAPETLTPGELDRVRQMRTLEFGGPTSLRAAGLRGGIEEAVTAAREQAARLGTGTGRRELISGLPGYEAGAGGRIALDELLMSNVPQARKYLARTGQETGAEAQRMFQSAVEQAKRQALETQVGAGETRQRTQEALGGAVRAFETGLQERVREERQAAQQMADAIRQRLQRSEYLTPEQYGYAGVTPGQYQQLLAQQREAQQFGRYFDPSQYLSVTPVEQAIRPEMVATPEEMERARALYGVAGEDQGWLPYMPTAAGTASRDVVNLAYQQAMNEMQQAIAAEKELRKPPPPTVVHQHSCFVAGTPVDMADGSQKNVEELEIGDEMLLGGMVLGTGKVLSEDLYNYKGTQVSGSHAVLEDGQWVRVKDSELSESLGFEGIVYPIFNENHLIVTNGFISADFVETDSMEAQEEIEQHALEELNGNTARNAELVKLEKLLFASQVLSRAA